MEKYTPPECNENNCQEYSDLWKLSNEEILKLVKDIDLLSANVYKVMKRRGVEHLLEGKKIGFDHHANK